jgi:hypothetical protein
MLDRKILATYKVLILKLALRKHFLVDEIRKVKQLSKE